MSTIDSTLVELYTAGIDKLRSEVPVRDKRILNSLARQIKSGVFLTENQASLLVKILTENSEYIQVDVSEPTWSHSFRKITQIRRVTLNPATSSFAVEFTFNKRIKSILTDLNKKIDGQMLVVDKIHSFTLTERNIYTVLTAIKSEKFDIDESLLAYYNEITSIISTSKDLDIFENCIDGLKHAVSTEINTDDIVMLADRQHRYQYKVKQKPEQNSIKDKIASRATSRIYINDQITPLTEVLQTIKELDRFPVMLVFNQHNVEESLSYLTKFAAAAKAVCPSEATGIYFRFEKTANNGPTDQFNAFIKDNGLNQHLDATTGIVGISSNQLPKFLFKTKWYPRSVISFANNFKNNKTSAYCDAVDLIIHYNKHAPISGIIDEIV